VEAPALNDKNHKFISIMKNLLGSYTTFFGGLAAAVMLQTSLAKPAHADQCVAYDKSSHQLVQIRPGYHNVRGTLADFNPCHSTVKLSMPGLFSAKIAEKPPVFIIVHGGGGLGKAETNLSAALNSAGIATLVFDAYQMNGYTREEGFTLFLTGMTNDARQRMTYKVALGAYKWLIQNQSIDSSRIFVQGLSNGGSVVANIAGAVDPKHVRAVFPEGASPSGLGFPLNINVPVKMIYGKLDNYGGEK
jgi:poly(3-hydroxybutyrate) depolymerase